MYHAWLSIKIHCIRKKRRIRFLFILQEVTQWKTETLYQAMLKHSRFEPIIGITKCLGYPGAEEEMIAYCEKKGYPFIWLDPERPISNQVHVDIVTHQKPYIREINPAHYVNTNKRIPLVAIPYYLSTITEDWIVNCRVSLLAWRQFIDNESSRRAWAAASRLHGLNYVVTGLPVMDELLTPKEELPDLWPSQDGRKRIIYAPHHTISDLHWEGIGYSTFLDYCEEMLSIRNRFKDQVYFVFKPHPSLKKRLYKYWGEKKTDEYYHRWDEPGISHVEQGKYLSLFKYSDAMIHDCGSFTVEYMYMDKPVMYLIRDDNHMDNMIPYAKEAFNLHYKGRCVSDIESFVSDVINGYDPLKEQRSSFKKKYLIPPNGRSACDNIILSILGEK